MNLCGEFRHPLPRHERQVVMALLRRRNSLARPIRFAHASESDRDDIYRMRHDVYALELSQHSCNDAERLRDSLDEFNHYLVARCEGELAGFVSITPPGGERYSLDKYLPRSEWPVPPDEGLYEIRILTVAPEYRSTLIGPLLMYAAFRWIERQGGRHIVAIGRREVLSLYLKAGMQAQGRTFSSGAVQYELICANVEELCAHSRGYVRHLLRMAPKVEWHIDAELLPDDSAADAVELSTEPHPPEWSNPAGHEACYHGGASFGAIGDNFRTLERRHTVVNADVLDAWFPPAPAVVEALKESLEWTLRTSPPTLCEGVLRAIHLARGVPVDCLVPGAGSSDLIFRAFTRWLTPQSRVLILDPMYGEYRHVLRTVIGCRVETLDLDASEGFVVDPDRLASRLAERFDLVCLVNPNNPTGRLMPRPALADVLRCAPESTKFWIDEAYLDYAGSGNSLESFAVTRPNVFVCKSLSKCYALSGARAAYLCAARELCRELRRFTPPWVIGLPAQVAAVRALESPEYYAARYAETHTLRDQLEIDLRSLGLDVYPSVASFLLCRTTGLQPDVATLTARCRAEDVFVRDVSTMTHAPDGRTFRVAVKDRATNERLLAALVRALIQP